MLIVTDKAAPVGELRVFVPLAFYWPNLLKLIEGLNDEGFMPVLFAEGAYDSRLEVLAASLSPRNSVWFFDRTDMARAKETVGRVACLQGSVPLSLLHAGTPGEVEAYCRGLIDTAGAGGGFLLDMGAVMHQGNDENLHAMLRTARDYGVYRRPTCTNS